VRGEFEYMSVRVNFAFEKSKICIENSINLKTSNHFSIQFSIENHSKWHYIFNFSTSLKQIPYRGYRLARNDNSNFFPLMSVRACLSSLVGRWISLLKKVKIVSRTFKLITSNYFSIQFSTENHSKWQVSSEWWVLRGELVD